MSSGITESDMSKLATNYQTKTQSSSRDINTSIDEVRDQLKNVIEKMGPHSPKTALDSSNDADNEESLYSTTSILSSVLKVQKFTSRLLDENSEIPENEFLKTNLNSYETHKNYCSSQKCVPLRYLDRYKKTAVCDCVLENCPCRECPFKHRGDHRTIGENEVIENKEHCKNGLKKTKQNCPTMNRKTNKNYYRIEMEESVQDSILPKRFIFDLVDHPHSTAEQNGQRQNFDQTAQGEQVVKSTKNGRVSWKCSPCGTKKKINQPKRYGYLNKKRPEKIDVYYFDHGNSGYFRTTDSTPLTCTDEFAQKTELITTKFWAELFGSLHIGCAFITAFLLQLLKFILYSIIRPLTIGIIQNVSDYFIKPFLAVLFNGILQPPLILLYNVATSIKDLCEPVAVGFGYFLAEIARVFHAIRFVEIRNKETPRRLSFNNTELA